MSKIRTEAIKCICGENHEVTDYESVNIQIDPELKKKVLGRKINAFKCDKCKYEQELLGPFLYHDMSNNLMVWVYPCFMRDEIENSNGSSEQLRSVTNTLGIKQMFVFGYDELFNLLDSHR